jgi:LacI family transcriptional regulator
MKTAKLKDIAEAAGVSVPLVSVALSGKTDGTTKLKPETKERILKIAKELNYRPNIFGRNLKANKSFLVGILFYHVNNLLLGDFIRGVQARLTEADYSPIAMVHRTKEEQRHNLELCIGRRVDGLIINSWINEETGENDNDYILQLLPDDFPCVEVFGTSLSGIPNFRLDYRNGFYNLCKSLINKGRKKIAYMCHDQYVINRKYKDVFLNAMECYEGYEIAMRSHSMPIEVILHPRPQPEETNMTWGDYAYEATKEVLKKNDRPDAIACLNTQEAVGVIKACHECGVKVPEEMAVCAYANPIFSNLTSPSITVCDANPFAVGRQTAAAILDRIKGEKVSSVNLLPEIIFRDSC